MLRDEEEEEMVRSIVSLSAVPPAPINELGEDEKEKNASSLFNGAPASLAGKDDVKWNGVEDREDTKLS